MKIAVVSDTHGRTETVHKALALMEAHQPDLLIHCGDIDDEDTVLHFPANTHFVFGNCDYEREAIRRSVRDIGATLHEPYGRLKLAGKSIGFIHSNDKKLFHELETSQEFDFLFYGHTHLAMEHRTGKTRVINPGALQRARPKTFLILHVETGATESVVVEDL